MEKKIESSKLQEQVDGMYKISKDKIEKHIEAFDEMFDRKPLHEEIIENLQEEISEEHISKFLETYVVDDIPGDENV